MLRLASRVWNEDSEKLSRRTSTDKGELLKTSCTLNLLKSLLFWSYEVHSYIWRVFITRHTAEHRQRVFCFQDSSESSRFSQVYLFTCKCWSGAHFWTYQHVGPGVLGILKKFRRSNATNFTMCLECTLRRR